MKHFPFNVKALVSALLGVGIIAVITSCDEDAGITQINNTFDIGYIDHTPYELNDTIFNVGDTMTIKLTAPSDSTLDTYVLSFDNNEFARGATYPATEKKVMDSVGSHTLTIKFVNTNKTDSISKEQMIIVRKKD